MIVDNKPHTLDKTPKPDSIISHDETHKTKISGYNNTVLEMVKTNSEFLMQKYGENLKQNNIWLIQIMAISGAILGGFTLAQLKENPFTEIGLGMLFTVISLGLFKTYLENANQIRLIQELSRKNLDCQLKKMSYQVLLEKESLTKKEQTRKQQLEQYFNDSIKETGLFKEEGTLGSVYEPSKYAKFDLNYFIIIGFFLSILIIIFPDFFGGNVELIWNTVNNTIQSGGANGSITP